MIGRLTMGFNGDFFFSKWDFHSDFIVILVGFKYI